MSYGLWLVKYVFLKIILYACWLLGRMADHWVKDEFADQCSGCGIKFTTLIERRHHCRDCGKVFCARYYVFFPVSFCCACSQAKSIALSFRMCDQYLNLNSSHY